MLTALLTLLAGSIALPLQRRRLALTLPGSTATPPAGRPEAQVAVASFGAVGVARGGASGATRRGASGGTRRIARAAPTAHQRTAPRVAPLPPAVPTRPVAPAPTARQRTAPRVAPRAPAVPTRPVAPAPTAHQRTAPRVAPLPSAAPTRPVAPVAAPTGALAVSVEWIAREVGVPPASLHAAAAGVQDRHDRVTREQRASGAEAELETRIAVAAAYGMPSIAAIILVVLGGGPSSLLSMGVAAWSAVAAAAVLTVGAVRWMRRLPTTKPLLLAPVARVLEQRWWWTEQVRGALDAAELHAAAGRGGSAALEAATSGDTSHPLRRLRAVAAEASVEELESSGLLRELARAEAADAGAAPAALARCSEVLVDHDLVLLQRRLQLRNLRMSAPFLLGPVLATLLVVTAATSWG